MRGTIVGEDRALTRCVVFISIFHEESIVIKIAARHKSMSNSKFERSMRVDHQLTIGQILICLTYPHRCGVHHTNVLCDKESFTQALCVPLIFHGAGVRQTKLL